MMRIGSALAAIILAAGLSACGGGGGDFAGKYTDMCKKQGGDAKMGDCSCQAGVLDKELDDKDKKAFLIIIGMMDPSADPTKMEGQLKDAGLSEADLATTEAKMDGLKDKIVAACKK